MRAFVALDLPDGFRADLERVQEELPGRHVSAENLHLTLAFLGDVAEARLADVAEGLEALRLEAPVLRVSGLDVFGGKRPNLCFAAIASNPALEAARDAVRRVCREAGVSLPRERFRPHVTLSRFGRELGAREEVQLARQLGVIALPEGVAEGITLYRSDLRPAGVVYSGLAGVGFD